MLLNIFAEPVTKVLRERTSKKQSTTCKMNLTTQAAEFRSAYQCQNGLKNREMQRNLIAEEYNEFNKAYHGEGYAAELKELGDLVYVCFQHAANMGWDLEEALDRIHKSNMSKLGLDGKPIRRRDGKVLKGPNYKPPNLDDLING